MDTLKAIEKLAQAAQEEKALQFDVANTIMSQIDASKKRTVSLLPFDIFSAITAVAASVVTFLSVNAWQYISEPLARLFVPLREISLW